MRTLLIITGVAGLVVLAGPAAAQDAHAGHVQPDARPHAAAGQLPDRTGNDPLPAGEEQAKTALDKSPRHGEWVNVPVSGGAPVRAWIVYPERRDKAPVVVVIHEIYGLSDWIRAVADQLARDGFIAIAPDLLSGKGPNGGNTDAFATRDDVVKGVRELNDAEVDARLDAVRAHAIKLPAANGKSASIGFCWGGSTSFRYATHQPALDAAVVYYGTAPDAAALATLRVPVLGLYGGDDERVDATIEPTAAALKAAGRTYEPHVYEGAGHGFLRAQTGRDGANRRAAEQAWPRTIEFLRQHTK